MNFEVEEGYLDYKPEAQKNKALDRAVEIIVLGSLLTLLLLVGTPLFGKFLSHPEGPSLQVIRAGETTQQP